VLAVPSGAWWSKRVRKAIHRVLPLSLTFDHRVVTGGEAARFLAALKSSLANP
jgi:2-oxoisovalerate dehydrogenase E2 component (dihydrolipoyl transacylase)